MFLQNWLAIVGCVQLLFAEPSKANACTFSINSAYLNPSCLSVSINDCKCTIEEIYPCGSKELSNCNTCCKFSFLRPCYSFDQSLIEDEQFSNVTIQFEDLIGWEIDSASCSLKRTVQQSSTLGQTSSISLSPGTTAQSESKSFTTPSYYEYSFISNTTQDQETNPYENQQNAIIGGGVVGGVGGLILIAAIVVIAIVLYRRRRKSPSNSNRTLANSTSAAGKQINDYARPNRVISILPAPFTHSGISPNEQSVNPPPFNPTMESDPYDNNYPIVTPAVSHGDTDETTVMDNQFYTHKQGETVTMATDNESDDTTVVDNQFYATNPSETVTMTTEDTTVFDNSFYGRSPVNTTTTEYYNAGRRS